MQVYKYLYKPAMYMLLMVQGVIYVCVLYIIDWWNSCFTYRGLSDRVVKVFDLWLHA